MDFTRICVCNGRAPHTKSDQGVFEKEKGKSEDINSLYTAFWIFVEKNRSVRLYFGEEKALYTHTRLAGDM
jgi:hypothetical protein